MRMDISQHMGMRQEMKLAPRMIQSMEILQLPIMQLEERLREEHEKGGAIELGPSNIEKSSTDLEAQNGAKEVSDKESGEGPSEAESEAYQQLVSEFNDSYSPGSGPSRAAGAELADKKHDAMMNAADRPPSLEDHLLEQLALVEFEDPDVRAFAEYLVSNLDRRGFLNGPLEEMRRDWRPDHAPEPEPAVAAAAGSVPIFQTDGDDHAEANGIAARPAYLTEDQAAEAILAVQSLEPTGVGAADLRECLLLQIDQNPRIQDAELLYSIVANHLDDLEHNRLPVIQRKTGLTMEQIHEAIEQLKHLELNPASGFTDDGVQYVVPDIFVNQGDDGQWKIHINDDHVPNVRISRDYERMLRQKGNDPNVLEYVKRKLNAARWLIESIEQRRNTIRKVSQAIVDAQKGFLDHGPDAIEPLKMQQIADVVGVHVTTVSRAVDDKWIQTPRGIFPLKRFFGGGTTTASGEEVAWDTIKRKLTEVVEDEDKNSPFSDEALVEQMAKHGYPLARRTVTKYRKMLGIPSSRQRKVHV